MPEYQARIYDSSGVLQRTITDFLGLSYYTAVNTPGQAVLELSGAHPLVSEIGDKWKLELKRRDEKNNVDWTTVFSGIYRDTYQKNVSPGEFYATFYGDLIMLNWRVVAWGAGVANRSAFSAEKAETILKTLVDYNAGSSATTGNGRLRTGTITGLTVQSDGAGGSTLDWYCHGKRLLGELQNIAKVAGGDFDLVKTGANAYDFRWYSGQLGTDRSSTVTFSVGLGNMTNPQYGLTRSTEKTVAVVGGQGEGADRDYVIRTGANYSASNDIEVFVDARDIPLGDTGALEDRGDQLLREAEAKEDFVFEVIQIPSSLWGVHYFLGDLVAAVSPFSGATVTRKVNGVTVSFRKSSPEKIGVELGNE